LGEEFKSSNEAASENMATALIEIQGREGSP